MCDAITEQTDVKIELFYDHVSFTPIVCVLKVEQTFLFFFFCRTKAFSIVVNVCCHYFDKCWTECEKFWYVCSCQKVDPLITILNMNRNNQLEFLL
jgi:hypothetical protein